MPSSKSKTPTTPNLRLVEAESAVYEMMRTPESTADRVKRLQAEARALALEQVEALEKVLHQAADMAKEIAEGGDAYPVGAREIAARLVADLPVKADTIKTIVSRSDR
ncbi:hypothetical protein BH10PSE2_BH10PSE2_26170 [soil metagenome]